MSWSDLLPVLTVIIGTILGWILGILSERRRDLTEREKEERQEARDRKTAIRRRQEEAALELDKLFSKWGRDLHLHALDTEFTSAAYLTRANQINTDYGIIGATAAHLPEDYRQQVLQIRDVMQYAQQIGSGGFHGGFHYHEPVTIIWRCRPVIHDLLAAYLRGEAISPWPEPLDEYIVANKEFDDAEMEDEVGGKEGWAASKKSWREKHAKELKALRDPG